MDALFLSGGNAVELEKASHEAKAGALEYGSAIRTYAMMMIVFGESDAHAEAVAQHYRDGLDEEALRGMMRAYGFLDAEIARRTPSSRRADPAS